MIVPADKRRTKRLTIVVPLAVLTAATITLVSSISGTLAAWTDDEYVSGGAGAVMAGDCSTTTLFSTESSARQISGFLGGQDLDTLVAVQGIHVGNTSGTVAVTPATATRVDPVTYTTVLEAGAFGTPLLSAVVGLNQPAGDAGVYTQWARARASGQAAGAAGLVSNQSGAIDATGTAAGSTAKPTAASINLASFVPSSQAAMTLDVGALASSSEVDACVMNNGWPTLAASPTVLRDYAIAGLRLNLSAASISSATSAVSGVLDGVAGDLAALASPSGSLTAAISAGVEGLVPEGGLDVGGVSTTAGFGTPDLTAARQLLQKTLTDGVVTIDLAGARIYFDLAGLTGEGLNKRDPNSKLVLDAAAVQKLTQRTSTLLRTWGDAVTAEIKKALAATSFTMKTTVLLEAAGIPAAEVTLAYATTVGAFESVPPPAPTLSTKVLGLGLLNLDTLLKPVTAALLGGTGAVVADALEAALFAPGGLLPTAEAAMRSAVVPVTQAADAALGPLANALTLTVNVQPDQPGAPAGNAAASSSLAGEYKVSALRVGAVGSTAELYLATASAGPVAFRPGGAPS